MSKHALVTGGNGFLGGYLVAGLQAAGYTVTNLSRHPQEKADINLSVDITQAFQLPEQPYSVVVHAAGKAHVVPKTDAEVEAFFQVNREGTRNLLAALSARPDLLPEALVHISTVAVYGQSKGAAIDENSLRAATDPYGLSKISAEDLVQAWSREHSIPAAQLRLPLVVAHEAPGNLGAMVKALRKGRYFNIAGGKAQRSAVLAQDVAAALPQVAKFPGTYNLTDGLHPTFAQLAQVVSQERQYGGAKNLPGVVAGGVALAGSALEGLTRKKMPFSWRTFRKMTHTLTFSDAKARATWGWEPRAVLRHPELWL